MKVYMDRQWCPCWLAPCEAFFGWRLERMDFSPGGCIVGSEDDGRPEITVFIKDRDGDKVLVIDEENRWDAYDSWRLLWERQWAERESIR